MHPSRTETRQIAEGMTGVVVKEEPCRLILGSDTIEIECRVAFRVDEFPSCSLEIPDLPSGHYSRASLEFPVSGLRLDNLEFTAPPSHRPPGYRYRFRLIGGEPILVEKPGKVVEIEAFLYNMGRFSFGGTPSRGLDPLTLNVDNWQFEISPVPRECRTFIAGMQSPWHRPTHYLRMRLRSVGGIDAESAQNAIFTLRQFLSFAWGRYVGIALAQGYSHESEIVFAHWGVIKSDPAIAPDARHCHWFNPGHAEVLSDILPGYWRRCQSGTWKDIVEWAIYWWLSANRSGQRAETSILVSQAGLEITSDAILSILGSASRASLKKMNAAARIREMLKQLSIPVDIPVDLTEIAKLAATRSWDGPDAFVNVRNGLAHPAKAGETGLAFEASHLGMWYLELVLLFLFDFQGEYSNRTVFDAPFWKLDRVPWGAGLAP